MNNFLLILISTKYLSCNTDPYEMMKTSVITLFIKTSEVLFYIDIDKMNFSFIISILKISFHVSINTNQVNVFLMYQYLYLA